jgi:hypothetical protein
MVDEIRGGVGCHRDIDAAARVANQDIAGLQHGDDSVATVLNGRLFVDALTVSRQVDGYRLVAEAFEFGNGPTPAPRAVESAVDENESHAFSNRVAVLSAVRL